MNRGDSKSLFSESVTHFIKTSNTKALGTEEEEWMRHLGLQNALPGGPPTILPCSWEIRLDKSELEEWKRSLNTNILSFDGTSKGNPGKAGRGGVIRDPTGNIITRYA